jgi:hypothetical protein
MGTRFGRRKDGRVDKPPYRVRAGQSIVKADKTDPANHATSEEATLALERGDVDAIGYVFSGDDPFFCVDLDKVIHPATGEINEAAAEIIHAFLSYTELSCSSLGVHVIGAGTKPEYAKCKSRALGFELEVYDRSRFVVLTGEEISSNELKECQAELEELCLRLWPKQEGPRSGAKPPNTGPVDLEDAVLLERARTSRSGPKFHKLYDLGDTSGHDSHSNADFSLLNMLIFWTAGDRERIITLFEASALYRQRGKHRNYAALSVDNALASYSGSFYQVRLAKDAGRSQEEREHPLTPYLDLLLDPSVWTGKKAASAYKTYVALVSLASEHGIFDDEGNLRIGCDMRRLAEAACTRRETVRLTGLPELFRIKLLRSRRPKGAKTTTFVLPNPRGRTNRANRVSTHFIGTGYARTQNAIETLRLLTRMRSGKAESATLLRLGMPAMFVAVAMVSGHRSRGYTDEELAEATGRRVRTLRDSAGKPGVLSKMKAAGVIRERSNGVYTLTHRFRDAYERHLELAGITYTEREQKRRHAEDRRARDAKLATHKQPTRLRGRPQMERLLRKQREEARRRGKEQEPKKPTDIPAPGEVQQRIDRLVREGASRKWARRTILAPDHRLGCECEVCS